MTVEGVLIWIVTGLLAISSIVIGVLWKDNKALRDKQEARADQSATALATAVNALNALSKGGAQ
jgi:hypothetical protein